MSYCPILNNNESKFSGPRFFPTPASQQQKLASCADKVTIVGGCQHPRWTIASSDHRQKAAFAGKQRSSVLLRDTRRCSV